MKKQLSLLILTGSLIALVGGSPAVAKAEAGKPAVASAEAGDQVLRVAIFPFESESKGETPAIQDFIQKAMREATGSKEPAHALTLGDKITELLQAHLTGTPAMDLVERAKIDKAFDELALGKTGLVDDATAARVGHMVGAQVLITGRAFPVDDELFIIAKVIGVETSRVFAAKVDGPLTGQLNPMVKDLSGQISKVVLKHDTELVGKDTKEKDYAALISQAVGPGSKPKVSVFLKEQHMSQQAPDPASETELIYLLQKAGFTIIDERNKQLSDWAATYLDDSSQKPPVGASKSDVIIVGEAFSEFAARRGELVSTKARVELRALNARTGEVLAIDRKTATVVDIAEHTAAKAALQKATDELALSLIPDMLKKWSGK
jgi:hypothetical protein